MVTAKPGPVQPDLHSASQLCPHARCLPAAQVFGVLRNTNRSGRIWDLLPLRSVPAWEGLSSPPPFEMPHEEVLRHLQLAGVRVTTLLTEKWIVKLSEKPTVRHKRMPSPAHILSHLAHGPHPTLTHLHKQSPFSGKLISFLHAFFHSITVSSKQFITFVIRGKSSKCSARIRTDGCPQETAEDRSDVSSVLPPLGEVSGFSRAAWLLWTPGCSEATRAFRHPKPHLPHPGSGGLSCVKAVP